MDVEADRTARRGTALVLAGAAPLLLAYYTVQMRALGPDALRDDLGVQHYLTHLTSRGAVPLVDFEHGWNAGAWYFSALLYRLAGEDPTLWTFLWGRAFGFVLAGLALLAVAWRLRLEPGWAATLVLGWMLVTHVPNNKYAIPLLWLLVLLPAARGRGSLRVPPGLREQVLRRMAVVAVVWLLHVELAILLGAGTALYDLFGAPGLQVRARLLRAGAVAAGLALGAGGQVAVYAAAGWLGPGQLLGQLLFGQAESSAANFGYPLAAPPTFRTLIYPASVVLPFLPVVWRRLSPATRLVAFLHLSQALIAIRRTDDNHIAAAATLLAVLAVVGARDLLRQRAPIAGPADARPAWLRGGEGVLGAAWAALAVAAGFAVPSRLALVGLTLACLAAVVAARWRRLAWASAGAAVVFAVLVGGGLAGHAVTQVRDGQAGERAAAIAAEVRPRLDGCLAGDREAWVVPGPLLLYDELEVRNPTPFYLFWYTLEAEHDRILQMVQEGTVRAVVQVGAWPEALRGVAPAIEASMLRCAEVPVAATGDTVTVWVLLR